MRIENWFAVIRVSRKTWSNLWVTTLAALLRLKHAQVLPCHSNSNEILLIIINV